MIAFGAASPSFIGPIRLFPGTDHMTVQDGLQAMKLQDLKNKKPSDLLAFAEELEIENASSMRKQDMLFAILKELADREVEITGQGVVEILQDGLASCDPRNPTTCPAPTTSTFPRPRSAVSACVPATPPKVRFAPPRKASAISPFSRSPPSISKTPSRSSTRSISTI